MPSDWKPDALPQARKEFALIGVLIQLWGNLPMQDRILHGLSGRSGENGAEGNRSRGRWGYLFSLDGVHATG